MVKENDGAEVCNLMVAESVGRYMLKTARQFIIEHKDIFRAAINAFAKSLPEPVLENPDNDPTKKVVTWENSLVLLRIRDKFMSYAYFTALNPEEGRNMMFASGWKILMDELEHDPMYRDLFQFLLEELIESVMSGEWKPRPQNYPPESVWKEPKPYGNLIGREFAKLIKGR